MWMMWKDQQQYHRSSVFDGRDALDCCAGFYGVVKDENGALAVVHLVLFRRQTRWIIDKLMMWLNEKDPGDKR